MAPQEALNLFIVIFFIACLIYEYIRDRKNEKKPAKVKAECIKRSGMEMTDNDIVKGLEYCVDKGYCPSCPCYDNASNCKIEYDALDLIKRQQAEIERLECSAKDWEETARQLFISRENIKAEAVKEFAERLKEESKWLPLTSVTDCFVTVSQIDNLVEEMVGEG